jgi:hypothetical protein
MGTGGRVGFNAGKNAGNLETSYSFSITQSPNLTALTFSPIPDEFPCLTPITRNYAAQFFCRKFFRHNLNIFHFLRLEKLC